METYMKMNEIHMISDLCVETVDTHKNEENAIPIKRNILRSKRLFRLFEDDTDDDEQSDIGIVVVPPETAEASDEEEGNNILNHDNGDLPCDTTGENEVHSKKKSESSERSFSRAKKFKK
ncbi:hypothetical protein AVEN_192186-1 [Araneus ventricosus]|uniref:Uncharacterized protein n=1 Tax=Araneus ventricosus TaxID=182803 RepID=A0A4Y2J2T0_ARAVE|nr:hypothetical protein AVEN_192186-1 [Araneus ventricosus]